MILWILLIVAVALISLGILKYWLQIKEKVPEGDSKTVCASGEPNDRVRSPYKEAGITNKDVEELEGYLRRDIIKI